MPAETALETDTKTLLKAVAFSLRYLADPDRGAGKSLPRDQELLSVFPNTNITARQVESWLYNEFGDTSLADIAANPQKISETLSQIDRFLETTTSQASVPHIATSTPKGRISAVGVLAELELVAARLKNHRQAITSKITEDLKPPIKKILPTLGTPKLDEAKLDRLTSEIAQEALSDTFEDLAKIQDASQINQVLADNLTQNIIAHPDLEELKTSPEKIYRQAFKETQPLTVTNQKDLEKAAVLANFSEITRLQKPDQATLDILFEQIDQTVETQAPLTLPEERTRLQNALGNYLTAYTQTLTSQVAADITQDKIPGFADYQKTKQAAHNQAVSGAVRELTKTSQGKILIQRIAFPELASQVAEVIGLKPISEDSIPKAKIKEFIKPSLFSFTKNAPFSSFGPDLALTSSTRFQKEAFYSLLAYNKPKLDQNLKAQVVLVERLGKKKSLTYGERKVYLAARQKLDLLKNSQSFVQKYPQRHRSFLQFFQSLPLKQRLNLASTTAWSATEVVWGDYPGVYLPKSLANENFLKGITFGSLASGFGRLDLGTISMALKDQGALGPLVGMGGAPIGLANRATKAAGLIFGGAFLYFLGLGQAALTGFIIGAGIGATVGGSLGFTLALATGPLFPLTVIPFTLGGAFVGGTVFGVAGGMIGLGMYSGSATAFSTGIGVGVGGTSGAVIGGIIGSALGPFGTFFGALIGAYAGSVIGGAIGYAIGHYVIGTIGLPATGALAGAGLGFLLGGPLGSAIGALVGWLATGGWVQIRNFLSGAAGTGAGAASGLLGTIGSFFTGLGAGIWGGITGAGGAILGGLSAAGNFIVGGLGSLVLPASAAAIPTIGGISAIAVGGTLVGIVTATSFFSNEAGLPTTPGENQFVSVEKLVSAPQLAIAPQRTIQFPYENLPQTLEFDVRIKAKANLISVVCSEETTLTKQNGTTEGISLSPAPPCPSDFVQNQEFTFSQTITVPQELKYQDSQIINTFSVNGTSDSTSFNASATATVSIGNPPQCAPNAVPLEDPWKITSDFGPGHPLGVDIADSTDRPIFSTFPCTTTVIHAGWLDPRGSDGYGYAVILQSGRYETISGHMNQIMVNVGDPIPPYGGIGPLGSTGLSSGPHVHYEIHVDGVVVNPHDYGIPYKPIDQY